MFLKRVWDRIVELDGRYLYLEDERRRNRRAAIIVIVSLLIGMYGSSKVPPEQVRAMLPF